MDKSRSKSEGSFLDLVWEGTGVMDLSMRDAAAAEGEEIFDKENEKKNEERKNEKKKNKKENGNGEDGKKKEEEEKEEKKKEEEKEEEEKEEKEKEDEEEDGRYGKIKEFNVEENGSKGYYKTGRGDEDVDKEEEKDEEANNLTDPIDWLAKYCIIKYVS